MRLVTLTEAVALTELTDAETVALPLAIPVTKPDAETIATLGSFDDQLTV
jgi:hypothetical protein